MKIYLLRHCESTFNIDPTSLGKDCELTLLGKDQAKKLTGHYDLVIISPLKRAMQTLELSNITYDYLDITHLAREHNTDICDFFTAEPIIYETEKDCISRAESLKKYIYLMKDHDRILLLSHHDIIWYLTSHISRSIRFGIGLQNGELQECDL